MKILSTLFLLAFFIAPTLPAFGQETTEIQTAGRRFFPVRDVDPGHYGNMLLDTAAAETLGVTYGTWHFGSANGEFSENHRSTFAWGNEKEGLNLSDQTISGWFLVDNQQQGKQYYRLFCMRTSAGNSDTQCGYKVVVDPDYRIRISGQDASQGEVITEEPIFFPGRWVHVAVMLGQHEDAPPAPDGKITTAVYVNGSRVATKGENIPRKIPGGSIALLRVGDDDVYSAGLDARPGLLTTDRLITIAHSTPSLGNRANLIRFMSFSTEEVFKKALPSDLPIYKPAKGRHCAALGHGSSFSVQGEERDKLVPAEGPWAMTLWAKIADGGWQTLNEAPAGTSRQAKTIIGCGAYPFYLPVGSSYTDTRGGWHLRAGSDRSLTFVFFPAEGAAPVSLSIPEAFPAFGEWVQIGIVRSGTDNGTYTVHAIPANGTPKSITSKPCVGPLPRAALKGSLNIENGLSADGDVIDDLSFWHAPMTVEDITRLASCPQTILLVTTPEVMNLDLEQFLPTLTETFKESNTRVIVNTFALTPSLRAGHADFNRGRFEHILLSTPIDVVVGLSQTSSRFIRANADLLPADVATVFVGTADEAPTSPGRIASSVVFPDVLDVNIEQALRLWPELETLFIVAPYPLSESALAARLPLSGDQAETTITVKTRFDLPENKLLESIAALPPKSVIIFGAWNDRTQPQAFNADLALLHRITPLTRCPILVLNNRFIGDGGATGGFLLNSRHCGTVLGEVILGIINGPLPAPITRLVVSPTFDAPILETRSMRIHADHLPSGTTYVGENFFFIERYFKEIAAGLGMILFLLLCMLTFTWINVRRRIRTQTLLEALPIQILMISPDNRVLPRPADAGLGRRTSKPLQSLSANIRAALEPAIVSVRQTGKPAVAEFTHADGRHMRGVCSLLSEKAYEPGTLLWVATDVHELYAAKMEALNSSALLHSVSNNMPGLLFVKDADNDFRYVMSNNAFAEALNQTTESIIGKDDFLIFARHEEAAECRRGDERALLMSGVSESQETFHVASGARVTAHIFKQTVRMSNGHRYVLGMGTDITRIMEMETTLRTHIEQEQRINANLQAVVSGQSAETVLTTVLSALGQQRGVCHSGLFLFTPGRTHFYCEAGWNPRGAPLSNKTARYAIDPNNTWLQTLLENRVVSTPIDDPSLYSPLKDLPNFRQVLHTTGADTLLLIAVRGESSPIGFLGLACSSETTNQAAITHFVRSIAHVLELFYARQRAEQQLLSSEREKRLILDTIQIPVLLFDNRLRLTHLNSAASAFAANLIKQRNEEARSSVEPPAAIALKTGKPSESNMTLGGLDYQVKAIPVTVDNEIVNIVETAYDVTQFNEAQRSLERSMEATQAAARAKSFFIATISHELRTPLNAVIGFSELMQSTTLSPEDQRDNLEAINIAGKTLLTLINDILDLSRLEAEQVEIVKAPMDLARMIHELKIVFKAACLKKGITLDVDVPADLPLFELDQIRIRQVLFNIVGNAVKFTLKGGVTVGITCERTGPAGTQATLHIRVADTGPGIEPQFRETIFEPFGQKNHVRGNTVYEGSGLGLSITRRLLNCMDGTLTLESELGQGSTFTILLEHVDCVPRSAVPAPTPVPVPELPDPSTQKASADASQTDAPKKGAILIVDDVLMNLKVLGAMLTRLGRDFITASSGEEALELATRLQPPLVLTDLWMPGMNGDELARRLKDQDATRQIPILALTADTQFDMQDSPFAEVLFKPLTLDKIGAVLAKY